jgi:hypothetical protein
LHLEFLNNFIFVAVILCFSCLFVYLFCVSFPFCWLSFSKVDNLFEFLLALFLSEVPLIFIVLIRRFCAIWRTFSHFSISFKVRYFNLQFDSFFDMCFWSVTAFHLYFCCPFGSLFMFGIFMFFFSFLSVHSLVVVIDPKVSYQWKRTMVLDDKASAFLLQVRQAMAASSGSPVSAETIPLEEVAAAVEASGGGFSSVLNEVAAATLSNSVSILVFILVSWFAFSFLSQFLFPWNFSSIFLKFAGSG